MRSCSKKRLAVLFSALTLISAILAAFAGGFLRNPQDRLIVLRVDDIQDFAFREAQLFLLNYSVENNLAPSLAIIAGMFGEDAEILEAVRLAVASGSEVGVHGWKHENLANLSLREQIDILFQAKSRIKDLLDVDTRLLIPPMFSFDNDTISAMHEESYNIISTCADLHEPSFVSEVKNIPATVESSILSNDVWKMKSIDSLTAEVEKSFELCGYAVILTHPQEFMSNGIINQATTESYISLLKNLSKTCQFTTFENLNLQK